MPRFIYDDAVEEEILTDKVKLTEESIEKLQNFLKEFNIDLSIRLLNTLVRVQNPTTYLYNYAQLTGKDTLSLSEKCKSDEYKQLETAITLHTTDKQINKRFKLYFGSAGTGKTTKALDETENIIVCHENITPKELIFEFEFKDGNPTFAKSAFCKAMENGEKVILDEINLLPFETIRFLQGVLDNKTTVTVGDEIIQIKDGFEVIGTMNEEILGVENYLPEPLIDRTFEIKQFILTPENLFNMAF